MVVAPLEKIDRHRIAAVLSGMRCRFAGAGRFRHRIFMIFPDIRCRLVRIMEQQRFINIAFSIFKIDTMSNLHSNQKTTSLTSQKPKGCDVAPNSTT